MENQNYDRQYNEEISIKELLMTLWNGKKLVIGITIGCIVLSAIYTFFIAKPVYEATSELIIQPSTEISTRYGTYVFPSSNPKDYINYILSNDVLSRVIKEENLDMTIDKFKEKISVKQDKEKGGREQTVRFLITTQANTSQQVLNINNVLVSEFIAMQRIIYKNYAIENFIDRFEKNIDETGISIKSQEILLKERKELLNSIPPIYTLQKSLFNDPETAATYADKFDLDLNKLSQAMLVEEYARGIYLNLEEICINTENSLIELKENLRTKKEKLDDLYIEHKNIQKALEINDFDEVFNNKADVFKNKVMVVSPAIEPKEPVKPRKAINLIVGMALGIILGVFVALFVAYWKNN